MFFTIRREECLSLHPQYFQGDVRATLRNQLKERLEGKCSGKYGFTILILEEEFEIGDGMLDVDTAFAQYKIKFLSLVFKPFKNEILLATVTQANSAGLFCQAGPLEIFVSKSLIPNNYEYEDSSTIPSYISMDGDFKLEQGTPLRVKLTGVRINANEIKSVGSIKGEMLGPYDIL